MTVRHARPPRPPSKLVRVIATVGVPLGILFGLLTLAALAAFAYNLAVGGGAYRLILAASQAVFFGSIAYSVGVEVPRNVRGWDLAVAERERIDNPGN